MADIKNTFLRGIMNKDLDERLVPEGQYRDALNITVETSEGSNVGAAQNSLGNTLVKSISDVSGRSSQGAKTIGSVAHEQGNLLYWFVAGDYFDGIYEYNKDTNETVRVLQSDKSGPGDTSKLNFNQQYPITGVNYIIGPDGNNFLYWTDDFNPPRRINITRVKSDVTGQTGYSIDDSRIDDDINVIVEPPLYSPHIQLINDEEFEDSNNISEKFLYFSYRYLYVDNQYSAMSPLSAVAFNPKGYEFDYGVGNNVSMTNAFNAVRVSFETGNQFVKAVQLLVRDARGINTSIVETYDKEEQGWDTLNKESRMVTFSNNKVLSAIPTDQVTRLFDNVPLLAKAQDVIGNRLAYGNYVQFRDIKDCIGDDIKIDYSLELKTYTATDNDPKSTWRSDRDYELALLYSDKYGRLTTAITCEDNSIHIPAENDNTANVLRLSIKHTAPCWATHYRLAIKESRGKYYNIFPILYYVDGVYRYLLINDSDIDKVRVGDYIKIKSDGYNGGDEAKRYKILEAEVKNAGFLSAVSGTEISGFYLKIKVDSTSVLSSSSVTTFSANSIGRNFPISAAISPDFALSQDVLNPSDPNAEDRIRPVYFRVAMTEKAIHYGTGNPNALQVSQNGFYGLNRDIRMYIEILENGQFRTTTDRTKTSWGSPQNITSGDIPINTSFTLFGNVYTYVAFYITIDQQEANVGDIWVVNGRCAFHFGENYYGGVGLPNSNYTPGQYGGGSIPTRLWATTSDREILPGATISIQCIQDSLGTPYTTVQNFFSSERYANIEEWFNESGAWSQFVAYNSSGQNAGAEAVTFRRGNEFGTFQAGSSQVYWLNQSGLNIANQDSYPVHMIIQGFGFNQSSANTVEYKLSISQVEDQVFLETVPKESDVDIYHELSQTYPIDNGNHIVNWSFDQSSEVLTGPNSGKTRLTLTDSSRPHYFTIGDQVVVNGTQYEVLATRDRYQMVIDRNWTGSVPAGPVKLLNSDNTDQSGTFTPAIIEINTPENSNCDFNAWTWGNGLESDRIYDDFNAPTLEYSVRATTAIDNYKQIRNDASICYSGVYNENTQYNRLNEFNLSLSNFKYLDREFGSIQRIYARDTDLAVFQENKVSSVLYEKNALVDSVGGGSIVSIPQVLGTQITLSGEYGISKNPESFAKWGDYVFFTDARRGVVMQLVGKQLIEISAAGMKDYFRDLMRDNPFTQKIGAYDPHNHNYVLHNSTQRSVPCDLSISRDSLSVSNISAGYFLFNIDTEVAWTITLQDTGDGTSWVADFPPSGSGSATINGSVSQNFSSSNRSVNFVISFCSGQTETFTLTQARGRKGKVFTVVLAHKQR